MTMNCKKIVAVAGIAASLAVGCQRMPGPEPEADYVAGTLIQFTGEPASPNGAWCWFQGERVIGNTHDAGDPVLMFTAVSASLSDEKEQGDLDFYWYGLSSEQGGVVELHDRLGQDDHNVAALFQLPNGQTLAAYARHNKDTNTYSRLSNHDNPAVWS